MLKLQALALASLTGVSLVGGALLGFGGGARTVNVAASSSPVNTTPSYPVAAAAGFDLDGRLTSSGSDLTRTESPAPTVDDASALAGDDPTRHTPSCHCGRHS